MACYRPEDYATPNGRLTMIYGPMFAGKTSRLTSSLAVHEGLNHKILLISHSSDDRSSTGEASPSGILSTHRKSPGRVTAFQECHVSSLSQVSEKFLKECDVIGIDEAQFFEDIEIVEDWIKKYHTKIYTAGLLFTSEHKMFGNYYKLLAHTEDPIVLTAVCTPCLAELTAVGITGILPPAHFTKCLVNKDSDVLIGSSSYIPVCRRHR